MSGKDLKKSSAENPLLNRWPHRIAVLLAVVVFPLIWVGGLVTTFDAGMAVPDWPGTYGYNMFLYPIETWLYGPFDLLVEHGHRLLGSLAGLIAIVLVAATLKTEPRGWVRVFSVVLLLMVILQGALGGVRVLLDARVVAKLHGCVGPAFFASVIAFCVVTSRWWLEQAQQGPVGLGLSRRFGTWALLMLVISYLQLVIGAFIRHIEVDATPGGFAHLVAMHVLTAVIIVLGTIWQWISSRRSALAGTGVRASINVLLLLVMLQFTFGLATWVVKYGWPIWFADSAFAETYIIDEKSLFQMNVVTLHVATGSLILAFWTIHALRCRRLVKTQSDPKMAVSQVDSPRLQSAAAAT